MIELHHGDCIEVMRTLPDNSVDSIVTDPPYDLKGKSGKGGFMGKEWDGTGIAFDPETWHEALRVLKPGGFLLAFGGTRTWHRLAVAVEDAGFDIKDSLAWLTGQGFPKHRASLKPAFEPVVMARKPFKGSLIANEAIHGTGALNIDATRIGTQLDSGGSSRAGNTSCTCPSPATDRTTRNQSTPLLASSDASPAGHSDLLPSAREDALSCPQFPGSQGDCQSSPCSCGERAQLEAGADRESPQPLGGVLEPGSPRVVGTHNLMNQSMTCSNCTAPNVERPNQGRWPANVALDEHMAAVLDGQTADMRAAKPSATGSAGMPGSGAVYGGANPGAVVTRADSGGASRFFYVAKAPKKERPVVDGVAHSTVKPLALMRWLVRLVTPEGGTVLEPFAGSGTTVEACILEGFHCIAIEREAEYLPLIQARIDRQEAA